jgi:hypothetical protein
MFMLKEFHVGELEKEERHMNAGIHAEFTHSGVLTAQLMSSACI